MLRTQSIPWIKLLIFALAKRRFVSHARPDHVGFVIEMRHWNRFFAEYFRFSLAVWFQKYHVPIQSPTTNTMQPNNWQVSSIPYLKTWIVFHGVTLAPQVYASGLKINSPEYLWDKIRCQFFVIVPKIRVHIVFFKMNKCQVLIRLLRIFLNIRNVGIDHTH